MPAKYSVLSQILMPMPRKGKVLAINAKNIEVGSFTIP